MAQSILSRSVAVVKVPPSPFAVGYFPSADEPSRVRQLSLLIFLFLCAAPLGAREGLVRTLDGRLLEGQVRLAPDRIWVVNVARGLISAVQFTNLALLSFPTNLLNTTPGELPDEALPGPWREADIGPARLPGSTRHEHGTFTVRGAGQSIDGEADAFHYVFQRVHGDSEIVAEVASIQYTHPSAKAGLMMRENMGEYSRHVTVALTARRGGVLQVRANEHASTESASELRIFAPHWLKLKRRANEFTAFTSPNGRVWSPMGRVAVPMAENFYVGLAVSSAHDGMLNWTTFRKVRAAPKLWQDNFAPEVELISGSVMTGSSLRAEENELILGGGLAAVKIPMSRVARIIYQPLSGELAWKTRGSRPGVWVSNGDFFDGEFRGVHERQITLSSVLYGLRTFAIDDEVLAVVVQPRQLRPASFELQTSTGATLLASDVKLGDGELRLRESALGEVRVPAFEIFELRRR